MQHCPSVVCSTVTEFCGVVEAAKNCLQGKANVVEDMSRDGDVDAHPTASVVPAPAHTDHATTSPCGTTASEDGNILGSRTRTRSPSSESDRVSKRHQALHSSVPGMVAPSASADVLQEMEGDGETVTRVRGEYKCDSMASLHTI